MAPLMSFRWLMLLVASVMLKIVGVLLLPVNVMRGEGWESQNKFGATPAHCWKTLAVGQGRMSPKAGRKQRSHRRGVGYIGISEVGSASLAFVVCGTRFWTRAAIRRSAFAVSGGRMWPTAGCKQQSPSLGVGTCGEGLTVAILARWLIAVAR